MKTTYCCIKFLVLSTLFFSSVSSAENYIYVPCPNYKRGDIINFNSKVDNSISNAQMIVSKSTNNMIEIVSNSSFHGSKMKSILIFNKKGNNLFFVRNTSIINGGKFVNTFTPPEPICGRVPNRYSFRTSVSGPMSAGSPPMNNTVTLSKIGDKFLKTPLGNLKTVVIKKTTSRVSVNSPVKTTSVSTSYNAQKYGKVKEVVSMITMMPDFSSMMPSNKDYDKVFENITASNIEAKIKQMGRMNSPRPTGNIKYRKEKHITTIDMIGYRNGSKH